MSIPILRPKVNEVGSEQARSTFLHGVGYPACQGKNERLTESFFSLFVNQNGVKFQILRVL